jgi:hypothetical protein
MTTTSIDQPLFRSRIRRRLVPAGILGALLCAWMLPACPLQAQAPAGDLPADLALVPPDAAGFISVRFADLWQTDLGKEIRLNLGKGIFDELAEVVTTWDRSIGLANLERSTLVFLPATGAKDVRMVNLVASTQALDRKKVQDALVPGGEEKRYQGKTYQVNRTYALHFASDRVFLIAEEEALRQFWDHPAGKGNHPLQEALRLAAQKHHLSAGWQVTPARAQALEKAWSQEVMGRTVSDVARRGLSLARPLLAAPAGSLTLDVADVTRARVRLSFPDEDRARVGAASARDCLTYLQVVLKVLFAETKLPPLKPLDTALAETVVETQGSAVQVSLQLRLDPSAIGDALRMFSQAGRILNQNNLRQIGVALHNFHADRGRFPAHAIYGKDGKPLLSWRVAILPYLEQDHLYRQFKLDEPWDSPHNLKLLDLMPRIYAPAGVFDRDPRMTPYQVFVSPSEAGAAGRSMFSVLVKPEASQPTLGIRIEQVPDGTANTLMVVEARQMVPWSRPADLPFDPQGALPRLGLPGKDGFHVLFADGFVRYIRKGTDAMTLRALITVSGAEAISLDALER